MIGLIEKMLDVIWQNVQKLFKYFVFYKRPTFHNKQFNAL